MQEVAAWIPPGFTSCTFSFADGVWYPLAVSSTAVGMTVPRPVSSPGELLILRVVLGSGSTSLHLL